MTRNPKKFREIARVCAVLSKSAATKNAIPSQPWPRPGEEWPPRVRAFTRFSTETLPQMRMI
jgi:hypothetical protein